MAVAAGTELADIDRRPGPVWQGVPHDWFALLPPRRARFWQDEEARSRLLVVTRYDDVPRALKAGRRFAQSC